MTKISIKGLCKKFGTVDVLKDVNLDIKSGEFVVFVGPSGCGKSTLLRCISGLESITSGTLEFGGRVVNDVMPSKRKIAMVFQSYALYPQMTVFENMAYSLKIQGESKGSIKSKVEATAKKLEILDYLDRLPKVLSGGQRQRVAIGRAIVRDPKVFLFDEPLSNLDAALRVQMRMEIAQLNESLSDTTMIYVTHDQVEAMTMADRIVILKDGMVQQIGTPMEVYEQPDSLFVAQFIGSPKMNLFTGLNASKFNTTTVGVRPEHLEIVRGGIWSGKVVYSENLGSINFTYVDIGAEEPIVLRQDGRNSFKSGDNLSFSPRGDLFYCFDEQGLSYSPIIGRYPA